MANPLTKKPSNQKSVSEMRSHLPTEPMNLKKKPAAGRSGESEVGVVPKAQSRSSSMGVRRLDPDKLRGRTTKAHLQGMASGNRRTMKHAYQKQTSEVLDDCGRDDFLSVSPECQNVPVRAKLDRDLTDLKFQSLEAHSNQSNPEVIDQGTSAADAVETAYSLTMPKRDESNTFLTGDGMSMENSSSLSSDIDFDLSLASSEISKHRAVGSESTGGSSSLRTGSLSSTADSQGLQTVLDMISVQTAITMVTDSGGDPSPPPCGRFSDTSEVPRLTLFLFFVCVCVFFFFYSVNYLFAFWPVHWKRCEYSFI